MVNSLSKTEAMTGWRIGWVVGPPEFIAAVTDRAALYGLSAKKIEPVTVQGDVAEHVVQETNARVDLRLTCPIQVNFQLDFCFRRGSLNL